MDKIAYHPIRVSPHASLFLPYSEEERRIYQTRSINPLRKQTLKVVEQNPQQSQSSIDIHQHSPPKYSSPSPLIASPQDTTDTTVQDDLSAKSISEAVAQYYNARPNLTKDDRKESPIYALRKFNNWIKSALIGQYAAIDSPYISELLTQTKFKGLKVLELGCGKGGDLPKWTKAGVQELYGFDIASVSIEQARQRHQESRSKFYAKFVALDCFSTPITSSLTPEELSRPFDAVSLQFCMHYAFASETKARIMMENVTKFLRPGGVFIGTIPDSDILLRRLDSAPESSCSFGNSIYEIKFSHKQPRPRYGFEYVFFLKDAVENVPEYVVFWEPFVELAEEYGLKLVYKENFHQIFESARQHNKHKDLLKRMKVVDHHGKSTMDADQWEATGLYIGFAFVKQ